jgi:hypothetical protein
MIVRRLWLSVLVFAFMPFAEAQSVASAELHGVVTDPSEAVVLGVRVQISNSASQLNQSAVNDANGDSRFLLLHAGKKLREVRPGDVARF